jgi:16S rRNA G1207 methylase RsmC
VPAGDSFDTPFGVVRLQRYPTLPGSGLLAWNAADRILLEAAYGFPAAPEHTLVVNDEHGALAVPVTGSTSWTDSRLSELACAANLAANRPGAVVRVLPVTEAPRGDYRLVLMRVPKQLSLFRYQLQKLRENLPAGTTVISAGMDKHLPRQTARLLEEFLGPTQRHPGTQKARSFTTLVDRSLTAETPPTRSYYCEPLGTTIRALPNVFSGDRLDPGSRLLLESWSGAAGGLHVVDLGCGAGVLGLAAARHGPARLAFIDESALAVASARLNLDALPGSATIESHFLQADGLEGYSLGEPDLVLMNPPFHDQHVVAEGVGRRLIKQVARTLVTGGELWLVGNRHLRYHGLLRRAFEQVERVAEDRRYIVWRALAS